ncbi:hypothetical protein SAMD00019534_021170 [Acytostelium subglobosum LB1]|uniref:hypothetical protein n=1 Tax=Acytostelium subglobosum LB1 TaxID=1410327 RepID=UPI0006447F79|nr:hypothetical protein SAMD00019534_021170 [Acytostelium subglobosum LB1]GAM18942.1 hypothetical protein SAMD00019534_021170 [Acytostelium subglobosum LB1]|eukprot:XP_012758162.1 hypothetical protein SAMD00019534_021170 [Acytostelium subglobosum LB1]
MAQSSALSNSQLMSSELIIIAKSTDKSVIKEHLKKYSLSLKNLHDQTLIHIASMHGNVEVVKQCLKKKYVNMDEVKPLALKDKEGYTAIHCAINQGHFDIADRLLSKGSDPNARTLSGSTPLHLLAKYSHHPKACKLAQQLIDAGAFVNHKDSKFDTPLHRATVQGSTITDLIKLFLDRGANPNIVNKRGKTCIHFAIEDGRTDLLELFLEYGAIFTKSLSAVTQSAMDFAKESKNPNIIQFFNERIATCGEYILYNEKTQCYIGKMVPTFQQTGDQFFVNQTVQLIPGRLFITNYRVVFRLDTSTSRPNRDEYSARWPFGEEEELTIPLLSIDSFSIDSTQSQGSGGNSSGSGSGGNSNSGATNGQGANNILGQQLIGSNNYYTLTIISKDYKHCRIYFTSQMSRERTIEIITFHSRTKIERILKQIELNQQLQLQVVKDNIHLQEDDRIEHIDRFECYGVFEEPLPYLFAHFVNRPAITADEDGWLVYSQRKEYARLGVVETDSACGWRFSTLNKDFKMCSTYPTSVVVPRSVSDKDLEKVFGYRSRGRIPILSWRSSTGASITRCSQPLVGIERSRCPEDEHYLEALAGQRGLYLLDARPKLNAIANTANGAGFENISNYHNCKLVFMNIANIHVMRRSLEKLVSTLSPFASEQADSKYWAAYEESGWMSHVRGCLASAVYAAELIQRNINVLVHCSDGWDRTPQITSLTQIILDPYYRTILGLQVLVEKEWLSFGHKFALRLGHRISEAEDERSPIFIQFLDALFQIVNQYPMMFEYTPSLLLFMAEHLFSCKYGTFLHNCEKERIDSQAKTKTISIWTDVNNNRRRYTNPFYQPAMMDRVPIRPNLNLRSLEVWKALYMRTDTQNTWQHNTWMVQSHQLVTGMSSPDLVAYPLGNSTSSIGNSSGGNSIGINGSSNSIGNSSSSTGLGGSASSVGSINISVSNSSSPVPPPKPNNLVSNNNNELKKPPSRHKKSHSNNSSFDHKAVVALNFNGTINSNMLTRSESAAVVQQEASPDSSFVKSSATGQGNSEQDKTPRQMMGSHR